MIKYLLRLVCILGWCLLIGLTDGCIVPATTKTTIQCVVQDSTGHEIAGLPLELEGSTGSLSLLNGRKTVESYSIVTDQNGKFTQEVQDASRQYNVYVPVSTGYVMVGCPINQQTNQPECDLVSIPLPPTPVWHTIIVRKLH